MKTFPIRRAAGVAPGRSSGSAFRGTAWAVATALDKSLNLEEQIQESFDKIDRVLADLGTNRQYLLTVNVFLSDLSNKANFDIAWKAWVGDNPDHWPQRMCLGATLSPGTLVEVAVVAAKPKRADLA